MYLGFSHYRFERNVCVPCADLLQSVLHTQTDLVPYAVNNFALLSFVQL